MMAPGQDGKNIPLHQGNIYDPKCSFWKDPMNVMSAFKTFSCNGKISRMTPSGYCDCTGYHGKKDRRRSFKFHKYFCTPCLYVKVGDEWKEPTLCPYNDGCLNCHTRFEQQFHPEVFKKMKCHDMVTKGECPRGPLCAFAHQRDEHPDERTWYMKPSEYLPDSYNGTPLNKSPVYPQKLVPLMSEIIQPESLEKDREVKTEVSSMVYAPGNPSFAKIAGGGGGTKPFCSQGSSPSDLSSPVMSSPPPSPRPAVFSFSPCVDKPAWKVLKNNVTPQPQLQPSYSDSAKGLTQERSNFISIGSIKEFSSSRLPLSRGTEQERSSNIRTSPKESSTESTKCSLDFEQFPQLDSHLSTTPVDEFAVLSLENDNKERDEKNISKIDPFEVYEWENPIPVTYPSPKSTRNCRKAGAAAASAAAGVTGMPEMSQFDLTPHDRLLWSARSEPPPVEPLPLQQIVEELIDSWNPNRNPPASANFDYQLFPPIPPHRKISVSQNSDDLFIQMENLIRSISPREVNDNSSDDSFDSYIGQPCYLSEFWEKVSVPAIPPHILTTSSTLDFPELPYQSSTILKGLISKFVPPCPKFLDAWNSHIDMNHPFYPCMVCKRRTPDGARKIVFHPCAHQVSCVTCYIIIKDCPLCGRPIMGKTFSAEWPPRKIHDSSGETANNDDYHLPGQGLF